MIEFVDGKVVTLVRFNKGDIRDIYGDLTDEQYQYIADILAANVEEPRMNERGYIDIVEENFNDCFDDMLSEIEDLLFPENA